MVHLLWLSSPRHGHPAYHTACERQVCLPMTVSLWHQRDDTKNLGTESRMPPPTLIPAIARLEALFNSRGPLYSQPPRTSNLKRGVISPLSSTQKHLSAPPSGVTLDTVNLCCGLELQCLHRCVFSGCVPSLCFGGCGSFRR